MINYLEMLGFEKLTSKPIKLISSVPSNFIKNNVQLILSYLAYKILHAKPNLIIPSIIYKPNEVISLEDENLDFGSFKGRIYVCPDYLYGILFTNKTISASSYSSMIVHGYTIFSKLFVRTRVRFISKDPVYVAYEGYHGHEVLVALRDIVSKYGISNDNIYKKRLDKIFSTRIQEELEESSEEFVEKVQPTEDRTLDKFEKFKDVDKEQKLDVVTRENN